MIDMGIFQIIFWVVCSFTAIIACRFGEKDEKIGIALIAAGSLATYLVTAGGKQSFLTMEWGIFLSDIVVFAAFVNLSLSSQKFWPIWVSSLQLVTVMTHIADLSIPNSLPNAYAFLQGVWVYPMFLAILSGTYGHNVLKRRHSRDHQVSPTVTDSVK
jgi:hypothetical protein